jgi:ATP-dependent Clp protease ATP-binding subunit ClpX
VIAISTELAPARARQFYAGTSHVIGQEKARRQMAVLFDRQVQVAHGERQRASGALLAGWTGSGKTMLARTMCQLSGLPFADVNATQYTEPGYSGLDLKQMFLPLIEAAARELDAERALDLPEVGLREREPSVLRRPNAELVEIVNRAEQGVILLDEFDKWMNRYNHSNGRLDTAVQADLLKMVEGSVEYVTDSEDEVGIPFSTDRVLIICAGAFVGLARLAARRLELDFDAASQSSAFWDKIEPVDFVKYGIIPELAGRLSTHIFLRPLQAEHLVEIMQQPQGIIAEYRSRFEELDCEWGVDPAAIRQLAQIALDRETGARGIEHVCWQWFSEALFDASARDEPGMVTLHVNDPRAKVA